MARDCIPNALSKLFHKLAILISRYPLPFLIVPVVISFLALIGIVRFHTESNVEYLYVPIGARSLDERDYFEHTFPIDEAQNYTFVRDLYDYGYLGFIFKGKKQNDIINADVIDSMIELQHDIKGMKFTYKSSDISYQDVCTRFGGECTDMDYLPLLESISVNNSKVTYPVHVQGDTVYALQTRIGNPLLDENQTLLAAETFLTVLDLRFTTDEDIEKSTFWLNSVRDFLLEYRNNYLEVEFATSLTIQQALAELGSSLITRGLVMYAVLIAFAVLSCMMYSSLRAKPWVAVGGVAATVLGIISAIGVLSAAGLPFISEVAVMPFLIMGIGLDDMFILVSMWRHTSCHLSVERRIGLTLQHSAVSITITSLTDFLAFVIGCLTPRRTVRIFCAYTGAAVLFVYLYAVTFVVACMVYSGRREQRNTPYYKACCDRSATTSTDAADQVTTAKQRRMHEANVNHNHASFNMHQPMSNHSSRHYRPMTHSNQPGNYNYKDHFESYGSHHRFQESTYSRSLRRDTNENDYQRYKKHYLDTPYSRSNKSINMPTRKSVKRSRDIPFSTSDTFSNQGKDIHLPWLTKFLKGPYANIILIPGVRIGIFLLYLVGVAFAVYGAVSVDLGLKPEKLVPDDSYFKSFFDIFENQFSENFEPYVMFGFTKELDYTTLDVKTEMDSFIHELQRSDYFKSDTIHVISWLHEASRYLELTSRNILEMNMTELIDILRNEFLLIPQYKHLSTDIVFSGNNQSIENSRFFVQLEKISSVSHHLKMLSFAREKTRNSKYSLKSFSKQFIFGDQAKSTLPITLTSLGIAVCCMLVVSAILIPNVVTIICITTATLSICLYTFGFMALWGVKLNSVSMITLIQSIGFSVDFAAHISYHFVIDQSGDSKKAARGSLGYVGTPIVQGAVSTLLAVVVLGTSSSFIFRTFFKTVALVMIFGFFHAMFVLPVVLATLNELTNKCKCEDNSIQDYRSYVTARYIHREGKINTTVNRYDMPFQVYDKHVMKNSAKVLPFNQYNYY